MTENQILAAQKTRIYKRMGIGSILGGFIFFTAGLGLAWCGNNMNPVTGLGVLVIAQSGEYHLRLNTRYAESTLKRQLEVS